MLLKIAITVALIMLLMLGWVSVQRLARLFAARHPQFGPAREEGGGCGKSCGCHGGGSCQRQTD
ncbi:MAG TPA: chemotaxis protein [Gammaproteobacteria bacterium]